MTMEILQRYWALVGASVLMTSVALMLAYRAFAASARSQLLRSVRMHQARCNAANKARGVAQKAAAKLQKLRSKRDSAKPRHVQEGAEALEDARALVKIAEDQVLIAANHVRN